MPQPASTHRLEPDVHAALDNLSRILHRPKNQLINEAVKLYVRQCSRNVEQELEGMLTSLRAHQKKDPDFEKTIDALANAEAQFAGNDPAEGRLLPSKTAAGRIHARKTLPRKTRVQ